MDPHMNITPEELDLIERYLAAQLTGEELDSFQQRLNEDAQWREKVEQVRLLSIGIQEVLLEQSLDDFHNSKETNVSISKVIRMNTWRKLAIAASIIVIAGIGAWWFFFKPSADEKLFAAYFKPDPGLPTTMSAQSSYEFDKAMVEYKTGNYEMAAASWERLLAANPDSDTLNYFTGIALLSDHGGGRCIPFFDRVIAGNKPAFLKEAYWYKGLALIKQGKSNEASPFIEKADHEKGASLLEKLR